VTDVFPAREPVDLLFSGDQIVSVMDHPNAHYISRLQDAVSYLSARLKKGDVLIVLSAGDADSICSQVLANIMGIL